VEDRVEDAHVRLVNEAEDQGGRDDRHHVRREDDRPQKVAEGHLCVEQNCQEETERDADRDGGGDEVDGLPNSLPEDVVAEQQAFEVRGAYVVARAADQVPALKGEPEDPQRGNEHEEDEERHRRRDQQIAGQGVGAVPLGPGPGKFSRRHRGL
jgi:hypothetical protein